jgi:type VI secretion system protein ImpK
MQELFTAIVRLRSNRQKVSDAEAFRAQVLKEIEAAEHRARGLGYSAEDTRQAVYAAVALLDESVLNSNNPVFGDWSRRPLQQELFRVSVAGEAFYRALDRLLARDDSAMLADILEVFYLCLLLGYGGRYTLGAQSDLRSLTDKVGRRIYHIRKNLGEGSLAGLPAQERPLALRRDTLGRWLTFAATGLFVFAVAAFVFYWFSLDSGVSVLRSFIARGSA